ncbi:MAG: tRNA (adenosine(37)-N6)-threonylcarbamoyltransferase complex ATPase subunit type 1 TsaE [Patescibacteria group bacterium]|nr:tRNA (adenosine(37)-N6)-threonylcarbamoyltransferase complex ATPase subunit type 1 TsaE [Patescibacteria group bacterium]MCL5262172.1 tRNA (adenosine(37)-N6)-threonylcarbamoyltransferase complex ATPase subunit type 1 TsaE [Patescibacteria group bacterium]
MTKVKTESFKETRALAEEFIEDVLRKRKPKTGALVLLLSGDLGSGKTTFIQGALRYFGVRRATSPTFVLMKHYRLSRAKLGVKDVYHVDAYRLRSFGDLKELGFGDVLKSSRALVMIEWPERVRTSLFKDAKMISFACGEKENERIIKF